MFRMSARYLSYLPPALCQPPPPSPPISFGIPSNPCPCSSILAPPHPRRKTSVLRRKRVGATPPPLRHKTMVLCNANLVCAIVESCVVGTGGLAPPLLRHKTMVLCHKRGGGKPLLPKTRCHPNWLWTKSPHQKRNYFFSASHERPSAPRAPMQCMFEFLKGTLYSG